MDNPYKNVLVFDNQLHLMVDEDLLNLSLCEYMIQKV